MKHLFTFRRRPNESLTGKLARVSSNTRSRVSSDTLSQVSNKCRSTVGRLSTLFLLLLLSFGFSSQAWAATIPANTTIYVDVTNFTGGYSHGYYLSVVGSSNSSYVVNKDNTSSAGNYLPKNDVKPWYQLNRVNGNIYSATITSQSTTGKISIWSKDESSYDNIWEVNGSLGLTYDGTHDLVVIGSGSTYHENRRAYFFNASWSTYDPDACSFEGAPTNVLNNTNVMFYIQSYSGEELGLTNGNKDNCKNATYAGQSGIAYISIEKSDLSSYDHITNNRGNWQGEQNTNIQSAKGGELFKAAGSTSTTAAKTATTDVSVSNGTLNISTTTISTTGVYNSKQLYIQYYIGTTFQEVVQSSKAATYCSIKAKATAQESTLDVSSYAQGTYTLKTVLTDGNIFYIADEDDFVVGPSCTTPTINWSSKPSTGYVGATGTLTASSTSGATVSYTSSNTSVASISGSTITFKAIGTTTITASCSATGDYCEGTSSYTLTVSNLYMQGRLPKTLGGEESGWGKDDINTTVPFTYNTSTGLFELVTNKSVPELSANNSGDPWFHVALYDGTNKTHYFGSNEDLTATKKSTTLVTSGTNNVKFNASDATYLTDVVITFNPSTQVLSYTANELKTTISLYKDGSKIRDITATYGAAFNQSVLTLPADTAKTGYDFNGFYDETSGGKGVISKLANGTLRYTANGTYGTSSNPYSWCYTGATLNAYAQYTVRTYTITLPGEVNGSVKVKYDATGTVSGSFTTPTKTGYDLKGTSPFCADEELTQPVFTKSGELSKSGSNPYITDNKWKYDGVPTIYTAWVAKTYPITFDDQDATEGHTFNITQVTFDAAMPAFAANQAPTKDYYDFAGYYTQANGQGTKCYNADGTSAYTWKLTPAETTTLYAYWVAKPATTITLNRNDGSGTTTTHVATRDDAASEITNLTDAIRTRTGYTHKGIYANASGGLYIIKYDNGWKYNSTASDYASSTKWIYTGNAVTFYSQWQANQYTITLNDGEGSGGSGSITVRFDNNDYSAKPVAKPTLSGYIFDGYSIGGVKIINAGGSVISGVSGYTDGSGNWIYPNNIELVADWVDNTPHTLTFGATNGTSADAAPGTVTATVNGQPIASGALLTPGTEVTFSFTTSYGTYINSQKGYTYSGWYDVANVEGASAIYTKQRDFVYTMPGTDANVYAYATLNKGDFTVASANVAQGTVAPAQGSAGPSAYQQITATPETGYHFVDWTFPTAGDFVFVESTSATDETAKVAMKNNPSNPTITANFEEITYTITLVGATATEVTAGVATHPTITANPAKFGQTFTGWSYDNTKVTLANDKNANTTITNATAETTITATYARNTDEYYIEGRFRVRDSEGGNIITTYDNGGQWKEDSRNIKFDYDESNGRFYKQTFMTAKELSETHGTNCGECKPYFYLRQGTTSALNSTTYMSNAQGKSYLSSPGRDNGATLVTSGGENNKLLFNTTDQSGNVTLYWDGTKIWYEVGELKYVVTFGAEPTGAGSLGATVGGLGINSGDEVTQGSNVVFTAIPTADYAVQGWYSDQACTQVIEAAGTNSSYTVENITAATNVYVKFTAAEVFFINTDKWDNVKIYDTHNTFGAWPGDAMTKDGEVTIQGRTFDVYKYNVDDVSTIIFNNGANDGTKKQTADLDVMGNYGKYFMADECFAAGTDPSVKPDGTWYNSLEAAQAHGLDCTTDVYVVFDEVNDYGTLTATAQIDEGTPTAITSGALVDKGAKLVFKAAPNSGYSVEGFYWNNSCSDDTRYTDAVGSTLTLNNVLNDTYVYARFEQYFDVEIGVADGQSAMGTTQPVNTIKQVGAISVRTAEAISSDPQLYSFDHWSLKIRETEMTDWTGKDDKAYGITLHDTCTIEYPSIRINATVADAKLTAHFKARDVVTLYFVNSDNWSNVHVHLWGGTAEGTKWPGIEPELYDQKVNGHDVYYVTFDNGAYTQYIWNCGNNCSQTVTLSVDKNNPVYNRADNKLYPSLDAVLPDPYTNEEWKLMFNDGGVKLDILNYDNSHIWFCDVEANSNNLNWVKMQQWDGDRWEWRGIYKYDGEELLSNKTIETYPSKDITVKTNDNGPQVELKGFDGTANFTFIFNDETHILTVDYAKPLAILTTSATEWDVDSKEPLVLRGYAKNATAACTYEFFYKENGGSSWRSLGDASATNVMEVTAEKLTTVPNKLGTYQFKVVVTTTHKGETIYPEATKDVYLYKYYWLAVYDKNNWTKNIYVWNGGTYPTAYPGDVLTEHLTYETGSGNQEWYFYHFRYPTYTKFKWNDGQATGGHGTGDITFDPNTLCYTLHNYTDWDYKTDVCPNRLHVTFTANEYYTSLDGSVTLEPIVKYYGDGDLTYSWTITSGSDKAILSSDNADKISVYPQALGDVTVKLTVSGQDCQYEKTATIHIINGITIRVYKRYSDWDPIIRTWGNGDLGTNYDMTNEGNGWYSHTSSLNPVNFMIMKNASTGNNYDKTINVTNVTESGCWKVSTDKWKTEGGDYDKHMIYKTDSCGLYFRVHETLADGKTTYHSNKVTKVGQDLSFYAANNGKLTLQHFDEAANKYVDIKTLTNPTESYVQVAKFAGNGVSDMTQYEGDYWLRTNAFGNWNEYIMDAQKFTEFTRNSRFKNEEYNYYFVHHFNKGTLVTGQVANRINDNLATFIKADAFTDGDGKLPEEGVSNVRFGYCPETNYFKRAIINGSSVEHFVEVYGDNSTYFNGGQNNSTLYRSTELTDANKIWRDETNNHSLKFTDMSDWVYQANVYATVDNLRNADTRAVIAAEYNGIWNYLLGYDDVKQRPTFAYDVLGSTSSKNITYAITLIYDFKTNRLMSAWTPTDMTVEESMEVDADVMFLRHENEDVAQIGIANETATVDNLNGVVFVLEVEDDSDKPAEGAFSAGNQEKHYWVSLPFDVKISDIFGLERFYDGVTGDAWGIQRYRGDLRAKTGWWAEGPDTWWEWMTKDDTMKAGEGYLISIDKSLFSWPSIEVDGKLKAIKRLYFPSVTSHLQMSRTKGESITQTYENQPCPFTRDRRDLKDGNWKVIGANSYNNAVATSYSDEEGDYNPGTEESGTQLPNFRYRHTDGPTPATQSYTPELGCGENVVYPAFYAYFVQYAGKITWLPFTTDDQKVQGIAPRRYVAENEVTNVTLRLELQKNGKMIDQTFVQFNDAATTSYDLNLDLGKFGCGSKISEISTLDDNGVVYAGNSMPSGEYVIPVGANIKVAGTYTFAMPAGTENMTVYLLDYETGDKIDLGLSNYTVTFSKKANLKDRFALMIDNRKLPTDTKVMDANGNELIKFIRNEQMYILRNGHLYNANGAELSK